MAFKVPYGIQAYRRYDLPQVQLRNCFAERVPQGKDQVALIPRAALVPSSVIGPGPINGLFQQENVAGGNVFAVSGSQLYSASTALGAVNGSAIAQFAAADGNVILTRGQSLYRSTGTALTALAFPDGASVSSVAFLAGYSIAARAGSRRLYFTLDTTTWNGLDYVSAEQSTESIVGISVLVDQLMVFCTKHTEFFYITGDADAPLQRVQGRVFDKGAKTRESIVRMDNSIFWVGHDGIVYRADNQPDRVSDHGIEERIAASASASAWSYPWMGHLFYVLQLDTETVAYDVATNLWHELGSGIDAKWTARTGILLSSGMLIGDDTTGQLYTLTQNAFEDGTEIISRIFTALIDGSTFIDTLTLDMSNADESDLGGLLEMRTSRDNGKTWLPWRQVTLGKAGHTRQRPGFRRVGMVDQIGMVIQFRITDPVAARVSSIRLNDVYGGRSR